VARHLFGFAQTRKSRFAVDVDEAASARAFGRAAALARCDSALLAQHLQEMHARFIVGFDVFSVQAELCVRHPKGLYGLKVLGIKHFAAFPVSHFTGRSCMLIGC
jgi:hypothetical protein